MTHDSGQDDRLDRGNRPTARRRRVRTLADGNRHTTARHADNRGTFPDYQGGRLGSNGSNRVALAFEIGTMLPWTRGQVQALSVTLTAQPGPGVRLVKPTILSVRLQRWDAGIRTTLAGDLDPLTLAGADRWTTSNGSVHIAPNADVAGSSFFLAVALNLTVHYQDGSSYATRGWGPDARTTFFDIP